MTTNTDLHGAMPELQACPFCGAPGSIFASSNHSHAWEGGCTVEGCIAFGLIWEDTEAEAIAAWNRRAAIEQAAVSVPEAGLIERIAQHWDGCIYDSHGEGEVDIGSAIRQNARFFAVPLIPADMLAASPTTPAAVLVPLSYEQIEEIAATHRWYDADTERYDMPAICRAVEAAHGINGSATREVGHG